MTADAFSNCHPAVNFLFFVAAIGCGMVIQHPAYILAGVVCGGVYFCLLSGRRGFARIGMLLPLPILTAVLNPLINHRGKAVLFLVMGKPYTLEALCYGLALGGIFLVMMLWFGCYSAVLTSDKFTSLFGSLIPSLSLLLVMVLRLIPAFTRKTKQVLDARRAIGMGAEQTGSLRQKLRSGMTVLSALTSWALEGSIITADSMRSRGYCCGKRTSFRLYRMTGRDWVLLILIGGLFCLVILAGGTDASYTPVMKAAPLGWGFPAYCALLLIPTIFEGKEAAAWHISISKI